MVILYKTLQPTYSLYFSFRVPMCQMYVIATADQLIHTCIFFPIHSLCSKAMDTTAIASVGVLVTLLGNEFHCEIVLGTKEYKKEFV